VPADLGCADRSMQGRQDCPNQHPTNTQGMVSQPLTATTAQRHGHSPHSIGDRYDKPWTKRAARQAPQVYCMCCESCSPCLIMCKGHLQHTTYTHTDTSTHHAELLRQKLHAKKGRHARGTADAGAATYNGPCNAVSTLHTPNTMSRATHTWQSSHQAQPTLAHTQVHGELHHFT
jgi:hypothetical protein